jgi:hypothetical protein
MKAKQTLIAVMVGIATMIAMPIAAAAWGNQARYNSGLICDEDGDDCHAALQCDEDGDDCYPATWPGEDDDYFAPSAGYEDQYYAPSYYGGPEFTWSRER